MKYFFFTFVTACFTLIKLSNAACYGRLVNPMTEICWSCVFPMTITMINLTPNSISLDSSSKVMCACQGLPPKVGVPFFMWEPSRLIDITRTPYCLVGLGGLLLSEGGVKDKGSIGLQSESSTQFSSYHAHYYIYPILSWLSFLGDFPCIENESFDIGYLTEFDPTWQDETWAGVMHPEAHVFANGPAQVACVPDCGAANLQKPLDSLFWCGGCLGSLYPFSGNVGAHHSPLQASMLIMMRLLAKLHRLNALTAYGEEEYCTPSIKPFLPKKTYKSQLIYPKPQVEGPCQALGRSDILWGLGQFYPGEGEDFCYLLWRKKQCCLDAVKPLLTAGGGR